MVFLLLFFLLYPAPAKGAEPHSHDDEVGRFYERWMRPDNERLSCCSRIDCYSTDFKNEGGTWFFLRREDAQWVAIPPEKFEHNRASPLDNPDGRNHICANATGLVFCAMLGGGA